MHLKKSLAHLPKKRSMFTLSTMDIADFRSDTVTLPTAEMRKAMAEARVGDDFYGDDPTVCELEALGASMAGKEAALFVPTGTFGNQLSLFVQAERGSEVILPDECHIVRYENGGAAVICGLQLRTIKTSSGIMPPEEVEKRIRRRTDNICFPSTGLIAMENTFSTGDMIPIDAMKKVREVANKHLIPVHLDGARLFNAAVSLNVSAAEIAGFADTVMFCLSKGLCAPIGSMIAGSRDFIAEARYKRKLLGGGMRQVGIIAAAGIIALEKMTKRLGEDHELARYLGERISEIDGVRPLNHPCDSNILFCKFPPIPPQIDLVLELKKKGILINPGQTGIFRFLTHNDLHREDVDRLIDAMKDFF